MLHLLALALIGGVIWVTIHALPLFLIGGSGWDDVRNVVLHHAYRSFTYEGDSIPGIRPSLAARLLIRALSPEDDARRALVTKAMAGAGPEEGRFREPVRRVRRLTAHLRRGVGASQALRQARWFTAPPLGAQFRARSVAVARDRAW